MIFINGRWAANITNDSFYQDLKVLPGFSYNIEIRRMNGNESVFQSTALLKENETKSVSLDLSGSLELNAISDLIDENKIPEAMERLNTFVVENGGSDRTVELQDRIIEQNETKRQARTKKKDKKILPVLVNGNFDSGSYGWHLELQKGAVLDFSVVSGNPINQTPCAKVRVVASTGEDWNSQLISVFKVKAGKTYQLKFTIKSEKQSSMRAGIQQNHDPWNAVLMDYTITPESQEISISTPMMTQDDTMKVAFMFGNSEKTLFWIDNVQVLEF